mmetsp:Transcript_6207/g.9068  ORF Transcript_6207/g.9068 Transcript_6207/m.9068 type:complete len:80 (+) Transcript_6207:564-803(+)
MRDCAQQIQCWTQLAFLDYGYILRSLQNINIGLLKVFMQKARDAAFLHFLAMDTCCKLERLFVERGCLTNSRSKLAFYY